MGAASQLHKEVDVLVVGFGFAGANAAIAAHDAGARVLLVEKMPHPGGISMCSAGGVRIAKDADAAFGYLQRTNAETAPDDVLRALAEGMTSVSADVERLARAADATVTYKDAPGIYPFPGRDTFGFAMIERVDGFDPAVDYSYAKALGAGALLFQVLERNIRQRGIEVWTESPVQRLRTKDQVVVGATLTRGSDTVSVDATHGVILACGGFEANPEMQAQYWQGKPVLSCAFLGNTGDGVRMAQAVGADLWHMWHYHGTYGFRVEGYPLGVRTKRLPDWYPGPDGGWSFDPMFSGGRAVPMPWILLNRDGRRFMNEYEPYMQDTGHRPFDRFRPETQDYPSIPGWVIGDDAGRALYPWGQPIYNQAGTTLGWSQDNLAEVDAGIIGKADSVAELASCINVDPERLEAEIAEWNSLCESGTDPEFGRPPTSMAPISTPPYYFLEVWPMVSNTQGGPVHDARQRVLSPFKEAIPGLYAAGELGSVFGHLYLSGSNLSECFIGGTLAGREAAQSPAL